MSKVGKKVKISIKIDRLVKRSIDEHCKKNGLYKYKFVERALVAELNKRISAEKALIKKEKL